MATDNLNGDDGGRERPFDSARKAFSDTAASFTEHAGDRARELTVQGKDRAVEALDNVAGLVGDAASQVADRLGDQYGGYIQQAADAVTGFADTLREKDADQLFDDARGVVRNSPAIALAAAAAVGFVLARVMKSGLTPATANDEPEAAPDADAKAEAKPRAKRKAATPENSPQLGEVAPGDVEPVPPASDNAA